MGSIDYTALPRTARWLTVIGLLDEFEGPSVADVASATVHAAEQRLIELSHDPSLGYCFWLLVRLASAARGPDFHGDLRAIGIPARTDDSLLGFLARVADTTQQELNRYPESGPFSEIARQALHRSLVETVGATGPSLFGSSLDDLERAFRRHSTTVQFGELAHRFFGEFYGQTLRYYVERELPRHVGGSLPDLHAATQFSEALDAHARQTARIVEGFAASWYSKHLWQSSGYIGHDEAQRFVAHAMTKLRKVLIGAAT